MADEELTISLRNEEFVKKLVETQRVIEATKKDMRELYEQGKKGLSDPKKIEEYDDKMKELQKTLSDVGDEQDKLVDGFDQSSKKIEKSGSNIVRAAKGWALGFATLTTAVAAFKKIVESTDRLSDKFAKTLNGWKEGFNALTRAVANLDFKNLTRDIKNAIAEGQRYAETQDAIGDASRAARIEIAQNNTKINELRIAQQNANLTREEQIKLGEEAVALLKRNSELETKIAEDTLDNDLRLAASNAKTTKEVVESFIKRDEALLSNLALGEQYNKLQLELAQTARTVATGTTAIVLVDKEREKAIKAQIAALPKEAKEYSELAKTIDNVVEPLRDKIVADYEAVESAIQAGRSLRVENALNADLAADTKKTDEGAAQSKEKYYQKLLQLQDEYDKAIIESLTGEDKLKAVRDYELKQIELFRSEIEALGELTPEMQSQLEYLAQRIHETFKEAMLQYSKVTPEQQDAISKALLSGVDLPGIQKSFIKTFEGDQFDFSLWDKLGFSEEDIEELKEKLGDAFDEIGDTLQDYYDAEFENAQRHREILDQRVSETQRAVEAEIELYKAGYASNVDAKKKELEDVQKARDKALAEEEKAQKRQLVIESALQAAALASAVANLFSKETKKLGLLGVVSAGIGVASMLVSFASSIAKINSATSYKLAEGGSGSDTGVVTGKRHSQGGERFTDHIEVEGGEAWGVLSRPATQKYGEVFHEMVSSFNKDKMPSFVPVSNSIMVENNGPNTRLDKVIKEQRRLNEAILSQPQVSISGSKKIVKQGNKIRIVG